jgi:hypothetical protein
MTITFAFMGQGGLAADALIEQKSAFPEPFRNVLRELYEDWSRRLGVDSTLLNLNLETATPH